MKTKLEHINSAYSKMRISGLTVQPTPEDLETALIRLEDMMGLLYGSTINIGYNFEEKPDGNSPSGVTREHNDMIASNLAIKLLPDFGKTATVELNKEARGTFANTEAIVARDRLRGVAYPSRMPRGSGNRNWNRYHHYYPPINPPETSSRNVQMYLGDQSDFAEPFDAFLKGDTIASFTIDNTDGLTIVSSALNADSTIVTYRVLAGATGQLSTSGETVTIVITTNDGRIETRERYFEISPRINS